MIFPEIRGVYVADVSDVKSLGRHRTTKHCVCVSIGGGQYLPINTRHNDDYDGFQILSSNDGFLNGVDRYLSCADLVYLAPSRLLEKVGRLNDLDAKTAYQTIRASKRIPSPDKQKALSEL